MSDQSPWASPEPQSSEPQRPQYGEYAPGYVPQQPAAPQPAPPAYQQPQQYGQPAPTAPSQPYGPGYVLPTPPRTRKTWDVVLTIILLVIGLVGVLIGLLYAVALPETLRTAFAERDVSGPIPDTGLAQLLIGISHPILYLVALGLSVSFLIRRRVAFWVPLAAGVIAALIFWICLVVTLVNNPAFVEFSTKTTGG